MFYSDLKLKKTLLLEALKKKDFFLSKMILSERISLKDFYLEAFLEVLSEDSKSLFKLLCLKAKEENLFEDEKNFEGLLNLSFKAIDLKSLSSFKELLFFF